jgi:hypothetical protein
MSRVLVLRGPVLGGHNTGNYLADPSFFGSRSKMRIFDDGMIV